MFVYVTTSRRKKGYPVKDCLLAATLSSPCSFTEH